LSDLFPFHFIKKIHHQYHQQGNGDYNKANGFLFEGVPDHQATKEDNDKANDKEHIEINPGAKARSEAFTHKRKGQYQQIDDP